MRTRSLIDVKKYSILTLKSREVNAKRRWRLHCSQRQSVCGKSQEWQALIWHSSWLVSKCSSVWFKTPGWNLQKTYGNWQLLFQILDPSSPKSHQPINDSPRNTNSDASTVPRWCWVLQQVLAAAVAVLITILDNFPYGFLLFPEGRGDPGVGISMVLLSAALAQVVFAMQSDLPVGCWVRKYGCFRKSWIFTD